MNHEEKMKCERCVFCGSIYPKESMQYYELRVFTDIHTICEDCYQHIYKK